MLRRIRLKNFIHFDEEQDIVLKEEGSQFCIGQNGSGKSAFLEAIRRCMSTSKNMGMSSSHDANKPSVAMCYFDFGKDTSNVQGEVISCVIRLPNTINQCIKLVYINDKSEVYIDVLRIDSDDVVFNQPKPLVDTDKASYVEILNTADGMLDKLIQKLETVKGIRDSGLTYDESTECEQFLRETVDRNVVITYPMRSIAPVQWTNSSKLNHKNISKTKQEIQERAEILSWYCDHMSSESKSKVHEYFGLITDSSTVTFSRGGEDKKLYACEKQGSNPIGIEKIPEGYYEAMNCAIILAYPGFKTICLEEPGRGMHPQMVERFRDLILKDIEGKVVVVTSHKPAFVAAWNIPRTLFFRKKRSGRDVICLKIIQVDTLEGEGASSDKTMRITTTRHFTTLYFARRVLLLEGDSDIIFVSEMKSLLLDPKYTPLLTRALPIALNQLSDSEGEGCKERVITDGLIDEFRRFMWPLHILGLNGEMNKSKLQEVCKKLDIERYFVLDFDAIYNDQGNKGQDIQGKQESVSQKEKGMKQDDGDVKGDLKEHHIEYRHFIETFKPTYTTNGNEVSLTEEDIRNDVSCLEKVGIFVWKNQRKLKKDKNRGTLETAIQELHYHTETYLRKVLETNRVYLQWDGSKKVKHRHKLFLHKLISDENIHNVMIEVLKLCETEKGRSSDIFRFVVFLCKIFLEYQKREKENGVTVLYNRQDTGI